MEQADGFLSVAFSEQQFSDMDQDIPMVVADMGGLWKVAAVGAAFLTEGTLLRGTTGFAGELGDMPINVNGEMKR